MTVLEREEKIACWARLILFTCPDLMLTFEFLCGGV